MPQTRRYRRSETSVPTVIPNRAFIAGIALPTAVLLLSATAAQAQQGKPPAVKPAPVATDRSGVVRPPARADGGQKWALLVGIDQYEDKNYITNLGAAAADARAIKRTLVEASGFPEDHVQLLVSDGEVKPTRSNILESLSRLAGNAKPGDVVFVLYSGHGIEVDGKAYLLPFDTKARDNETITDTALDTEKFYNRLRQVKARAVLLAFDMCRSDPRSGGSKAVAASDNKLKPSQSKGLNFARSSGTTAASTVSPSVIQPVALTLFSCSPNERSYEWQDKGRGYFSLYLERGLRGEAADTNGNITVGSLSQYLSDHVRDTVKAQERKSQQPYGKLEGPTDANRMVLFRGLKPGSGDIPGVTSLVATAVPLSGKLLMAVTPANAVVKIAGQPITGSEYAVDLADASSTTLQVEVSADGYKTVTREVTVERGQNIPLAVALEAAPVTPGAESGGVRLFRFHSLSPARDATIGNARPAISAAWDANAPGVEANTNACQVFLDGTDLSGSARFGKQGMTLNLPRALRSGAHQVTVVTRDTEGRDTKTQWSFTVDPTASPTATGSDTPFDNSDGGGHSVAAGSAPVIVSPRSGMHVQGSLMVEGYASPNAQLKVTVRYSGRVSFSLRSAVAVLAPSTVSVTANSRGYWKVDNIRTGEKDGDYTVEVTLADGKAGKSSSVKIHRDK